MIKIIYKFLFIASISILLLTTCKEKLGPNPTLRFFTDAKYTYADDSLAPGDSVLVGLKCNWNGTDLLTGINVYRNDIKDEAKSIAFNDDMQVLGLNFYFTKKADEEETFSFELTDAGGNTATLGFTLTIDSTAMTVTDINDISLGAQDNTSLNKLYSLTKDSTYAITDTMVTKNYVVIDFIFGSDGNNAILGSPATDWTGIYDLSNWKSTDSTRFAKTSYTDEEYYELTKTDLVSTYKNLTPVFKLTGLAPNEYYVFKTSKSKYGMIKVKSVNEGNSGSISFDLKIEK